MVVRLLLDGQRRVAEPKAGQEAEIATSFSLALREHRAGRISDAERLYRQILAHDQNHIHSLYNLGLIYLQSGQPQPAVDLISRAVKLRGHMPEWHYNLAIAYSAVGRPAEAIEHYRTAIGIKPDYVAAHMNLGNALVASGDLKAAAACYECAIEIKPELVQAHYNLANALVANGELEKAVATYEYAIKLKPDFAEAHNNLAIALAQQDKRSDAIVCYQRALAMNPNLVEAYVNIGRLLADEQRLDDAIEQYRRAVTLKPDFAQAYNNMGVAFLAKRDIDAALEACRRALAADASLVEAHDNLGIAMFARRHAVEAKHALVLTSDFVEAHNDLARLRLAEGKVERALGILSRALKICETPETKTLFVYCLKDLVNLTEIASIRPLIVRAFTEPWGRQNDIARFCARLVTQSREIGGIVARATNAWPNRLSLDQMLRASEAKALANNVLLTGLLDSGRVPDVALERFLTLLRSAFLNAVVSTDELDQIETDELCLYASLARLCFLNEYVFACSDEENQEAEKLHTRLASAMQSDEPIPEVWVAAVGAYFPLQELPGASSLCIRSWRRPIAELLRIQIGEPEEEERLQKIIPRLTVIEDRVSIVVREQYEENPYPRWVHPAPAPASTTIDEKIHRLFPAAAFRPLGKQTNVDVLIAGCGTGQRSIEIAQGLQGARVLAVDLSLASLRYAKRQALALGIDNIEYAQADILQLPTLGRAFDVIEAAGVLHHLANPSMGLQILASLLRPTGLLFLALYSDIARRDVVAVRDFIAAYQYPVTVDGIRRCRQALMDAADGTPMNNVTHSTDFYSTSECRDFLFHVHEHRMTLPELKALLDTNRLQFLGFETEPRVRSQFTAMFPENAAMIDLDQWHIFEQAHPYTFARMYHFWTQKMDNH
jgi:tetratricopeptide (TPR) repeat protein/2-polyprenyl-3-methyl-5-hydroxy-6-metoxy-1,4-benzoquinol methylase